MKTNVLMKIAVVFMAAFGAYAFSGNTKTLTPAYVNDGSCHQITNPCDRVDNFLCEVIIEKKKYQVWSDLGCTFEMKHSVDEPIRM